MYQLTKKFRFEASHQLIHHDGKCADLHGHSWCGKLIVVGDKLEQSGPKQNMLVDYTNFPVRQLEATLDHKHLNDVLGTDMPTSEYLAKWVYDHLLDVFPGLVA